MTIQHTPNYGIAYADTATALVDLAAVTQEVAQSLDAAMGRAGYTPPDASDFAALAARVTAAEVRLGAAWSTLTSIANTFAQAVTGTVAAATLTGHSVTVTVPAGATMDVEYSLPSVVTGANSNGSLVLVVAGQVKDGATFSTGAAAIAVPALKLTGHYANTGSTDASVTVAVQAANSGGTITYQGGQATGVVAQIALPPRIRARIV